MAVNKLRLEVPDTLSKCILRVMDVSTYDPNLVPKCFRLEIGIPGFSEPAILSDISPGFSLNLTACDLKIQSQNCGKDFNDLPDGIYVIRYSVSPNDVVFVTYNHLRETKALNKVKAIYCELDLEDCISTPEKQKQLERIRLIQDYLVAAKSKVEWCREASKGLELYKKAMNMLEKFNCSGCHK